MGKSKYSDKDFIKMAKDSEKCKGNVYKAMSEKLGVPLTSMRRYIMKGFELMGVKAAPKAKTDTKVVESGVNGLTLGQIAHIQKTISEGGSKLGLSKELKVSRYKIDQALKAVVIEHDNDVKAASVTKVGYEGLRIGVVFKVEDSPEVVIARYDDSQIVVSIPCKPSTDSPRCSAFNVNDITVSPNSYENPSFEVLGGCEYIAQRYDLACRIVEHKAVFHVIEDDAPVTPDESNTLSDVEQDNLIWGAFEGDGVDTFSIWSINVDKTLEIHNLEKVSEVDTKGFDQRLRTEEHIGEKLVANQTKYRAMILPNQITIVDDGVPKTVPNGHPNFAKVLDAVKAEDWESALKYIDVKASIHEFMEGLFELKNGKVLFEGIDLGHRGIETRILAMATEGDREGVERAARFITKVMENPSNQIVKRIYDFMKFADVEISDDGDLYAYKAVNGRYLDCHSGTILNTPGTVVEMRRNRVNENDNQTCSYGLHVCALSYLPNYSGSGVSTNRIVRVKLNPADIVSIPTDYKDAKIRCCRYEVVNDVSQEYRQGKLRIDRDGIFAY